MANTFNFSGTLFMIAAPSGAGKSTLVNALLAQCTDIELSISCTTRLPRSTEKEGREYHFISNEQFLARRDRGEFLEYAEVHGNFYGTSKHVVMEKIKTGTDVLLEIDWQGAQQIKKQFPQVVSIFILPPSIEALEVRLNKRAQDTPEIIARRIAAAHSEIAHAPEFEYAIINQDFETALAELSSIVQATRCRFLQQSIRRASLFERLGITDACCRAVR